MLKVETKNKINNFQPTWL